MGIMAGIFGRRPAGGMDGPRAVPRHVAIIMDGNGRWARRRGLPRSAGHRAGMNRLEDVIRACIDAGVKYLTLYAFSTENWRRDADEISFLMRLFNEALTDKIERLHQEGVKVLFIGRRDRLQKQLATLMAKAEQMTAGNEAITLILAIDYGGRDEIVRAARRAALDLAVDGGAAQELDEARFAAYLDTAGIPDPDLIIRPSGEVRLSNFLLWQAAYAELLFVPTYWPDFGPRQLNEALAAFAARERRYGNAR